MRELWHLTAAEIAEGVRAKTFSANEVLKASISRLEAVNPDINAVVMRTDETAKAAAQAVDDKISCGDSVGPLAGVPITVKVNVDQSGFATTNGVKLQSDLIADEDSPVVANLKRAGAVIIGRTNTPAFSIRWFTRNALHGHTRNPVNKSLTPGGSSGGAAAAVAAGIGAIAHGTDIAGSVRYPAYACGLQGIRPTLGRVPAVNFSAPDRHIGAQLMAVSGPLARSVEDLRIALTVMAAKDTRDPWWTPAVVNTSELPKRVALTVAPDGMDVDPAIVDALHEAANRLKDAGWEVVETECPPVREAKTLQLMLWLAEFRRADGQALIDKENDPDANIVYPLLEAQCGSIGLNDILDALQRRVGLMREWNAFFETYPVMLCPVSGELPFQDLEDVSSPEAFSRILDAQLLQIGLPLMGLPGASVFTGMTSENVPTGVQLVAGKFCEEIILDAAADIESRGEKIRIAEPS